MYYDLTDGKITGIYAHPQEGKTLLPEGHPDVVAALAVQAQDQAAKEAAEQAYAYASARARDYVSEFSKAPQPSQVDAIGHLLDAILGWIETHEVTPEIQAILDKREAVKQRNPKP